MADTSSSFDHGKPKSSEQIRAALQSVRREPDEVIASGPQTGGIGQNDKFPVAAFYQSENAKRYQASLLDAGIMSAREESRGETRVSIDYADRERALAMLGDHLRDFPNMRPTQTGRGFDLALFGGMIGLVLGLVVTADHQTVAARNLMAPLVSTVVGALIGLEIDWLRNSFRRYRRVQFGIREFLVLVVILPLMLLFLRLLPEWMR